MIPPGKLYEKEEGTEPSLPIDGSGRIKEATITSFKDHFSLSFPTSTIRYRSDTRGALRNRCSAARVFQSLDHQFVLEEAYDETTEENGTNGRFEVTIRQIIDSSYGLEILRLTYTIFTAVWVGILFIICVMILLYLCLDVAIEFGLTNNKEQNIVRAIGVFLSLPALITGLTSSLVLAFANLKDTWKGHPLIRNFTFRGLPPSVVEWIFFIFFLGLPLLAMAISLLLKTERWWSYTCFTWLASIIVFYLIFWVNVAVYEVSAGWNMISRRLKKNATTENVFWKVWKYFIIHRQIAFYGGRKRVEAVASGTIRNAEDTDLEVKRDGNVIEETRFSRMSLLTYLTKALLLCGVYESEVERLYTMDDVRDIRPYITKHNWGLEKVFCLQRPSRYIVIVKGPGAITVDQLRSSIVCSFLGALLILILLLSAILFLKMGVAVILLMLIPSAFTVWPFLSRTIQLLREGKMLKDALTKVERDFESDFLGNEVSTVWYITHDVFRITKPKEWFCFMMFALEVNFLFFWPLLTFLVYESYLLAALFAVCGFCSGLRHYINAAVVLQEVGSMKVVAEEEDDDEVWSHQSRLSRIVGDITHARSRQVWFATLVSFLCIFFALMALAIGSDPKELSTSAPPLTYLSNFSYTQRDKLRYASCELPIDASPVSTMADYAFLSFLAYREIGNATQIELNGWFGPNVALNNDAIVDNWRAANNDESAVSFKLVEFPAEKYAFVLIRGTLGYWDMMADAQIWFPAVSMQFLREILPFGSVFTPIFPFIIRVISTMESKAIEKVSFYKTTTNFVNYLLNEGNYSGVAVAGHSLGGGLAMITAAQTGVAGVALSGPNVMLSRQSFDPPITRDQINANTFNIIPSRDIVPKIDEPGQNFQTIGCNAAFFDFMECHNYRRTLCEIIYTCGSDGRPVLCECADEFGFPPPEPISADVVEPYEKACSVL